MAASLRLAQDGGVPALKSGDTRGLGFDGRSFASLRMTGVWRG